MAKSKWRADADTMALWKRTVYVLVPGKAPEIWPDWSGETIRSTARRLAEDTGRFLTYPQFRFVKAKIDDKGNRTLTFKASATVWEVHYQRVLDKLPTKSGSMIPLDDRPLAP